jgi:tetratricopeptide (TPR) repeat protein
VNAKEMESQNESISETPETTIVGDNEIQSNDTEKEDIKETKIEKEDANEEIETELESEIDIAKEIVEPEENMELEDDTIDNDVETDKPLPIVVIQKSSFSSDNTQRKKVMTIAGVIIASIIALIVIIAVASSGAAERKMNKALDTQSAYEVNALYSQAYGDSKKLEKYDKTISQFLNKVLNSINNAEYSDDDLAENGYTVVYRDLANDWGNLIYSEDGDTIEASISYYNQTTWDEIQSIIKSRAAYCSGVAYRDSYKQPKEAIESFKQVTSEDSYYSRVDEEIAKCVDLYVEQTLAEAQELIDNDDISGAISKIDSINNYLENNGLTSDTVQEKLEETKTKYAESYVKKAEDCFKKKDVNGAIGNIEVAIELSPENAEYKAKKDTYEMYLPFYMYESDNILSTSSDRRIQTDDDVEAVNQKVYNNCLTYRYYQDCKDGTVKYLLEGKYDTVTGVYFSPKANASMNRTGSCYFVVYGDGKEIYKSKTISAESKPIDFSFSVKDIQNLEITFVGTGSSVWGVDAYSFGDYACIAELTAQKNFPEEKGE